MVANSSSICFCCGCSLRSVRCPRVLGSAACFGKSSHIKLTCKFCLAICNTNCIATQISNYHIVTQLLPLMPLSLLSNYVYLYRFYYLINPWSLHFYLIVGKKILFTKRETDSQWRTIVQLA